MSELTYEEACYAMQAGVGLREKLGGSNETTPKHLRVGVNSAMVEHSALARLLIAKGVITEAEYRESLAEGMREEVALYERGLTEQLGKRVTLGYDKTEGRGVVTIDGGLPCGAPTSSRVFAPCTLQRGHDGKHYSERTDAKKAGGSLAKAFAEEQDKRAEGATLHNEPPPVDRSARTTLHGMDPDGDEHREVEPETGMQKDYIVLSAEERAKGFQRPVRRSYKHVGRRPKYELRDLTPEEQERHQGRAYVKYEAYPELREPGPSSVVGRFWTQKDLDSGCGTVTTMGLALAETYARDPAFYSGTFCCGCGAHFPVGEDGEFVWDQDGTKVGT